jgi:hypothetical protein
VHPPNYLQRTQADDSLILLGRGRVGRVGRQKGTSYIVILSRLEARLACSEVVIQFSKSLLLVGY